MARTTESIWRTWPSTSSTFPCKNLLIPGTTLILPDLIFWRAPMSNTGVFPAVCLNSKGPTEGLFRPYFSTFPKIKRARISSILSTIHRGSLFINITATSKVDFPKTSFGKTWTWYINHQTKQTLNNTLKTHTQLL